MSILIWVLLAIGGFPVLAEAAIYYADPSGSGAASCVDSGANVCTLVRAEAVATNGDEVIAACGTYSLGASTLTVNINVNMHAIIDGCAIVTGTNTTSIVTLAAANDANTLTFKGFNVQNTGGATTSTMLISNVAYDATVALTNTTISVGGTARHIADQWTRGTVLVSGLTLTGTMGSSAGFYSSVTPSSAKKLSITNSTFTLTLGTADTYGMRIERTAGSAVEEWVYLANNTVTITVPPAMGDSASVGGIRLNRITSGTNLSGVTAPSTIENNIVSVTATNVTSVSNYGILVGSTDATAVADYVVIQNNTVTCNTPTDRCISIGSDGTTLNYSTNVVIAGNTVTSVFYNGTSTPHAISLGRVTGGLVRSNKVYGGAVGILLSINQGGVVSGNLVVGSQYAPLFSKGSGATTAPTFVNNTVIMDDIRYGSNFGGRGCMAVEVQSGTNTIDTNFYNNICYVISGTAWKYVNVPASQAAHFDANDYYSEVALSADPWSYTGSTYATVALWNAVANVGADLNIAPSFISASDFRTRSTSAIRRVGIPYHACIDVRGRMCNSPPDIGAYQASSGDAAGERSPRK